MAGTRVTRSGARHVEGRTGAAPSLRPAFRRGGLGTDTVRVLCRYGFEVRGLHRLQIETLADNQAMMGAWVCGEFLDEVILGLLADEWRSGGPGPSHTGDTDPGRTGR